MTAALIIQVLQAFPAIYPVIAAGVADIKAAFSTEDQAALDAALAAAEASEKADFDRVMDED